MAQAWLCEWAQGERLSLTLRESVLVWRHLRRIMLRCATTLIDSSIHLALEAAPVLFLQLAPQHFAGRGSRKRLDHLDTLWRLERRDALARPGNHVVLARRPARLRHDDGFDLFAPALRRYADHGDFGDVGMTVNRVLDFGGINIFAAGNDHVLHAIVDVEVALVIEVTGVAGAQPTVFVDRCRRRIRLIPISLHVGRRADRDLADFLRAETVAGGINNHDFHTRERLAGGAHLCAV